MKIKPIIKTNNKFSIISWILEKFPTDYQQMRYVEPFVGNGSILLNKEKSIEEVVGDNDPNIINIWRVIRDECKLTKSRLSKIKYSEKSFNELKSINEKDYSKQAVVELCLRRMSKSDNKESFDHLERKKSNENWKCLLESLDSVSERISNVYFLEKKSNEIISSFDSVNSLCFCSPPSKETSEYIDICEQLKSYRGKVVFCAENLTLYRRMFSDWKAHKNKNKKHIIWCNF